MAKENKAVITLFGAAGDLAQRKLYPSLFKLYQKGYIGDHFALLGTSRRQKSDEEFQEMVAKSISSIKETEKDQVRSLVLMTTVSSTCQWLPNSLGRLP